MKELFLGGGDGVAVGALMILLPEDGAAAGRQLHHQSEDTRSGKGSASVPNHYAL